MPTPSAARPQDAARLEGRSGSMHAVPLAAPWRVVSVARPVMVEYKVSATTATTTCLTLWDPARCSHSAPKRAGMGGASAQGYNAPNHADSMRVVQVLIIGDNSYLARAARSIRALRGRSALRFAQRAIPLFLIGWVAKPFSSSHVKLKMKSRLTTLRLLKVLLLMRQRLQVQLPKLEDSRFLDSPKP